jgi:hypothetical protein
MHLSTLSSTSVIESLHDKAAASTTTKNGTFWFCGEKPCCEFFFSDENCYMYTRAVAAFRGSGSIHPVCLTHQKFARLCVVKDTMKDNYGQPFLVCSERKNPCKFWQWGDVLKVRDRYVNMVWCAVNEKSRKMVRIKIVCFILLSEGRLLWFLRMEATRTSCNQHWYRALQ